MSKKKTTPEEEVKPDEPNKDGVTYLPEFGEGVPGEPTGDVEPEPEPEPEPEVDPEKEPEPEPDPEKKPEKEPEEAPKFEFVEPEVTDKPFMTVTHQGKEVAISTEEEAKNFIQKGYDYDFKVGPHGKLARALEDHPEFGKRVAKAWEDYASGKPEDGKPEALKPATKPELKSIDEYDNPNDWFWDNHEKTKVWEAANQPPPTPPPPPVQQQVQQQGLSQIDIALMGHDPQHFHTVAPLIKAYAEKELTKAQYERIDNDLPSLFQYYDHVKKQVIQKPKAEATPDPPFRVQSGGGEAPSVDAKPPWDTMNNDEFEQEMSRIKGIASY